MAERSQISRPIPKTISAEARRFYQTAEPLERWTLADGGVDTLREEEHAEAESTNEAIIETYVGNLEERELAGVTVQIVTPREYDVRNDGRAILYLFGGAYVVGSPVVDLSLTARLAHRLGIRVYAPYYRRAPEHPFPAAVDDALAVYRALLATLEPYGIGIAGESAGGNLTLAMTLRAGDVGLALPAAIVLLSPWCDLTPSGESQREPEGFDPTLDYALHLEEAAAAYAGGYDHKDPRISPLYANYTDSFPPTLITTGTRELCLSDCARLSTVLRRAGVDARLHVWEGMWHTFEWYHEVPEAEQSMGEIAAFFREHLVEWHS
ncbi:MAG: alpha/beta hydrolase [Woeseiaceae bacterium]